MDARGSGSGLSGSNTYPICQWPATGRSMRHIRTDKTHTVVHALLLLLKMQYPAGDTVPFPIPFPMMWEVMSG